MTIERATMRALAKPWGSADRLPWSSAEPGSTIGEVWFGRDGDGDTDLLLKLLFTRQALSIQVHPDDAMARTLGEPRGKTEAWYVLAAEPGAELAKGLHEAVTPQGLRTAIADGSIRDMVQWQTVKPGDVIAIPAGTIHALGANLVVAELQQRSDTTFRLFDFGRGRELHADLAVTAADCAPAAATLPPRRLTAERVLLTACPYFVLERLELPADTAWQIDAATETWLLVIEGAGTVGPVQAAVGEAVFMDGERAPLTAGPGGMTALVGMVAAAPADGLLRAAPTPGGRA